MRRFAMAFVAAVACVLLASGTAEARGRRCGGCHSNCGGNFNGCGGNFSGGYYGTNGGFYGNNGNNVYWNGTSWQQNQGTNITAPMPANTNTTPNTTNQQNQTTNPQNPSQQNAYYYGGTNVTPSNGTCTNCYHQQNNFFPRRIFGGGCGGGCSGCHR